MIETVRFSIHGPRPVIEDLHRRLRGRGEIGHYPAGSALYISARTDTDDYGLITRFSDEHSLDVGALRSWGATPEELEHSLFFSMSKCRWIEDDENAIDPPVFTTDNLCEECYRGAYRTREPLVGELDKFRTHHLLMLRPCVVIASARVADEAKRKGWTGVDIRPIINRKTGQAREDFVQFQIESLLPDVHPSTQIERTDIPDACESCRRVGYRLTGAWQVSYAQPDLRNATSWNLTRQWFGASSVSGPEIVCSREVVHSMRAIDPRVKWIPVEVVPQ